MSNIKQYIPGLLATMLIAVISYITFSLLQNTWLKISALLWSFIFSIIITNLIPQLSKGSFKNGIEFSSQNLMKGAIALFGLTFSIAVWGELGIWGILMVIINLLIAFTFGLLFCRYVMKMKDTLAILISVGTCICGATAIAATAPAIKTRSEETGLSVAVITLFGLAAMFLYPLLFESSLGSWLNNSTLAFGMWAGTGIHETAQVIAAASQVDGASAIAISAKFIRIFMIGPMVFLGLVLFSQMQDKSGSQKLKFGIPWFAVVFILFTLVNFGIASSPVAGWWAGFNANYLKPGVIFLLAWAFAGVGMNVKIASIRSIGLKSFLGGLAVACFASICSLLLIKFLWMPLASL